MARAKRHFILGYLWHITHQATPSASTRQADAINENSFSNIQRIGVDAVAVSGQKKVEEQLQGAGKTRQDEWTCSIALGSRAFIENVKARLRFRAKGRDVIEAGKG